MWKSLLLAALLTAPATAEDKVADTVTTGPLNFLPTHVGGRVHKEALGYSYQWPGVYFEARFSSPFVNLIFDDSANNFNVLIDGKPLLLVRRPGHTTITVQAAGPGPHTVRVEKRSETQYATGHFQGFLAATAGNFPARARQIEFIGDSLTVGYGNTSAYTQCTPDEIFETTDTQEGFGPLTAKHFDADYQINAFSGLGMVRNYDGREHPKYHMPMLYDRAIFDEPAPVAQPDWHPQVIVIGIGGNDFSTPVRSDEPWGDTAALRADYVKTYTAFVKTIRARNPNAFLILATPPHREDGYSGGTDDVYAAEKAAGDLKIDRITLPELESTGCNGHPNTRSDARVADFYIKYLEDHLQLWQGK